MLGEHRHSDHVLHQPIDVTTDLAAVVDAIDCSWSLGLRNMIHLPGNGEQRGMGAMLHWILPRLAAYVAVVVAAGLLFLAGASVYALMWPKPVVPFGQMGP